MIPRNCAMPEITNALLLVALNKALDERERHHGRSSLRCLSHEFVVLCCVGTTCFLVGRSTVVGCGTLSSIGLQV